MATKYSEVVLAVRYRERNDKGDWVGGPMYYIKNGLGKSWSWLGGVFCVFGFLAAFGIGNMTQVNTLASSINTAIDAFGGNVEASSVQHRRDRRHHRGTGPAGRHQTHRLRH